MLARQLFYLDTKQAGNMDEVLESASFWNWDALVR